MNFYKLLDLFFLVFHLILVIFVLTGWIWKRTRTLHLAIVLLTLASWFILGLKYGIGYCPLTDWHFQVLRNLGETNLPNSYISYIIARFTGMTVSHRLVDIVTAGAAFGALGASLMIMFLKSSRKKTFTGKL